MSRETTRKRRVWRFEPSFLVGAVLCALCLGCPPPWPPPPDIPVQVNGFDRLPDGSAVPSGTEIADQYGKEGIVVAGAQVMASALFADLPAESSPNVLLCAGDTPRLGALDVRFVRPSDGTSPGESSRVGAVFLDVDDPEENARLEAYDRNDRLLGVVYVNVGEDGSRQYVGIEAAGIARVRLVLAEGGDGCAVDDVTYAAVPIEMFLLEAYPAYDYERKLVENYLRTASAGKEGDVYYASLPERKRYISLRFGASPEAFARALETPGAVVGFTGHSNFGLGALFSELPDHSQIEWVTSIADYMNLSTPFVGASWPYLVHEQAYPNLWISDEEIAVYPENYCTPVGVQRFPNDDGVGVCETFGAVQGEGIDRYHYRLDGLVGDSFRLVVHGGSADLPDPLRYAVLYYRSCNSGIYYSESFQRGVLFYTTFDSIVGAMDVFVKGTLHGWDWDLLKRRLNLRQNNNDYFDFTRWSPFDRCDENCG